MGLLGMLSGATSGGGGVNVGSAIAYLELNTEAFNAGLSTAMSKLDSTKNGIGSSLNNLGSAMTKAGATLTKSVTLPVVGLGTAAVKTFADFEQGMADVKAIAGKVADGSEMQKIINTANQMGLSYKKSGDMTETAMNIVAAKAEEVGRTTEWTSTQAAEAFKYMALAGWDVSDMLLGIDPIINLATASGEDLATVSDIVTDSLTAFGLEAKDTAHFTDILAQAQRSSNTTVSKMGESFKFAAPQVGALGMSAEDTAVALGLMANQGIKSSMAGTSLRSVLSRMAKPTKESQIAMDQLGIALEDDNGQMVSMKEIFDKIRETFKAGQGDVKSYTQQMAVLDEQYASGQITQEQYEDATEQLTTALYGVSGAEKVKLAAMLAGKTGMSGLMAIVNASEEDYNKLTSAIQNCSGATDEMAEVMRDTTENKIKLMTSAIDAMLRSFGELLAPTIQKAANWIRELADKINGLDDSTKEMIVTIGLIAAAVGPVLIIFGTLAKSVGTIITVFGKIGGAIMGVVGHFVNVGSAASNMAGSLTKAGTAASSAGTSFSTFAGEALKMVAAAAVILAAAAAVKILSDSAIELYNAGPGAIATFAGLTAAAILMTAAIAAIGSACTAGAAGLLALGAAVLMGAAGIALMEAAISLLVEAVAKLVVAFAQLITAFIPLADKMPIFAEYGLKAAAGMAAFGAAVLAATPGVIALDLALAAFDVTAAIAIPLIDGLAASFTALNITLMALTASVEMFGNIFVSTITAMAKAVDEAVRLMIKLMTDFVDAVIELFKKLKYELIGDPIVLDIVDGIVNAFKELVEKVIQFVKDLVNRVIQHFKDLLREVGTFISNVLSAIGEFISNAISKVVEFFSNIINKTVEFFSNMISKVKEFLSNLIQHIVERISEIVNKVKEFFANLIQTIIEKTKEIYNKVKEFLAELIATVVEKVQEILTKVKDILSKIKEAIFEFVQAAWEKIKEFVQNVIDTVTEFIENMISKIKDFFSQLISMVKEKLQEVLSNAKEQLGKIIDFVKELIPKMLDAGKKLISSLWEGMKEVFGGLWSWVQESFGKIISFVERAADKVRSIGNSIRETVGNFIDGSHATGLSYVPYNGYVAQLHEGERVLTKQENRAYTNGRVGGGDTYNIYSYEKLDEYGIRRELMKMKRQLEL